jgi:hypothetical protein
VHPDVFAVSAGFSAVSRFAGFDFAPPTRLFHGLVTRLLASRYPREAGQYFGFSGKNRRKFRVFRPELPISPALALNARIQRLLGLNDYF